MLIQPTGSAPGSGSGGGPSRCSRRSTALTKPAARGSAERASSTDSETAAKGRDAQEEQLVGAQAERLAHGGLQRPERPAAEPGEHVVEPAAATERAEHELVDERPVARVVERRDRGLERLRRHAPARDTPKHLEREHGAPQHGMLSRGARRAAGARPAAKAAAGMALRLSG